MKGAGQVLMALTVASALAWRGLKKRSLTVHGAVAAFVVGLLSFTSSMRSGMLLIAFYQSGSTFTKFKAQQKATLDASSDDASSGRGVSQVLACSLLATLLSLASLIHFGIGADCVCSCSAEPLQSAILCGIIGHYACCAADTWASELGILDPKVRLITNPLIMVPPGTNGGVSLTGTAASLGGGVFIGSIAWFLGPPGETLGIVLLGNIHSTHTHTHSHNTQTHTHTLFYKELEKLYFIRFQNCK
jgi:uncharacterized protein (TIGR00297 family)